MSVRRRLAVIGVALGIIATAGALYLKPEPLNRTEPLIPARYEVIKGPYNVTYDFISPLQGWALATTYNRNPSQVFIFKTSDGGEHWQKQYSGSGGPHLHFFDAANGFLYGGDVLRTVDGGDHWQVVETPGDNAQIAFGSPLEGWGQVFAADGIHLYRTVDGGQSWKRTGADPPPNAIIDSFSSTSYGAFRRGGEAWLIAEGQPDPVVFVTRDGGSTWDTHIVFETYCCGPGPHDAAYDTSVLLFGADGAVVSIRDERYGITMTLVSLDGGYTWDTADFPVDGVAIDEAAFVDTEHWWVFHSDSVYVTEDRGRSWMYVHDFGFPGSWNTVGAGAIDATHAWKALTSTADSEVGALALTSDGGLHWRLVNAPQP